MSTSTLERPDVDVDDILDFAPRCCLVTSKDGKPVKECENTAEWVGYMPCCGRAALVCEEHRQTSYDRPFQCKKCRSIHPDLLNWARL